jgi:TPR repeat protein
MYYWGEGIPQDYNEAARWYRMAAEKGDVAAQIRLATMYYWGEGIPQDYNEAARWYRMAAEKGYAKAQFNLGNMYHEGEGVPQDYNEAARWYRMAAEKGYAKAQIDLGYAYLLGKGVPEDNNEAARWFRKATEQAEKEGDVKARLRRFGLRYLSLVRAQFSLGLMYYHGKGVAQDYNEAARWYRIAAEGGHAKAKEALLSITTQNVASERD